MTTIALEQTQTTLSELIHRLTPGEEVIIFENDRAVARLVLNPLPSAQQTEPKNQWPCKAGSAKTPSTGWRRTLTPHWTSLMNTWNERYSARQSCLLVVRMGRPLLSPAAKKLIEDPANHKWVSVASCWEIAIKVGLKKLELGQELRLSGTFTVHDPAHRPDHRGQPVLQHRQQQDGPGRPLGCGGVR